MRSLPLPILAAAVSASIGLAQSTHVIPIGLPNGAGNSSNSFPWGTSAAGFPGLRVMTCYDSSNFTTAGLTTPIRITRLKWRANDSTSSWTGGTFAQGAVSMATAAVDHTSITTSFAQNAGNDASTVYSGPVHFLAGAGNGIGRSGPVVIDVSLTTPFIYDPAAGDLIIDVDYPGGNNYSGGTLSAMDVQTGAAASRAYASSSYPVGNGTTTSHGAVVEVDYVPANGLFAAFKHDRTGGGSPLTVQFTDASYSSAPAGITGWAWDFENDGIVDSTQRDPIHTFANCGRYSVALRVTDGVHAAASFLEVDSVVTDEITPDFTYRIIGQNVVLFADTSSPPATSVAWDLDGDHVVDQTGATAVWVYPAGTTMTNVTLTASRLCGSPASVTRTILPAPALLTTLDGGNGLTSSGAGNVFDLQVVNPAGINITALTMCPLSTTAALGAPIQCDVYLTDAPGGFALNHADAAVWRRVASASGTFQGSRSTASTVPVDLPLDHRLYLPAGNYSMALHMTGCGLVYTTGNLGGGLQFANADLRVTCGLAKSAPFAASANSPRLWNGVLHYDLCSLGSRSGYGWFAPGCSNSAGIIPGQTILSLPTMGQTFAVRFDGLPSSIAFAVLGFSHLASPFGQLPLDLTGLGAPNCMLRVSPDDGHVIAGTGGSATMTAGVPLDPAFLCLPFYVQALALDVTANAAGWVAGDAGAGIIGN